MHIAKKNDGKLEVIRNLDEKKPDPNQLRNVEEIYVVAKVLVPVLSLKPKPRQERDRITKADKKERHRTDRYIENKAPEIKQKRK